MSIVRFKKEEINLIMDVYSRKISTGEWKDYSISFQKNYAILCKKEPQCRGKKLIRGRFGDNSESIRDQCRVNSELVRSGFSRVRVPKRTNG